MSGAGTLRTGWSRVLLWAALLFGAAWLATWVADDVLGLGPLDPASVAWTGEQTTSSIEARFFARLKTSFGLGCLFSTAAWLVLLARVLPAAAAWTCRLAVVVLALVASDRVAGWWQPFRSAMTPDAERSGALSEAEIRSRIERRADDDVPSSSPLRLSAGKLPAPTVEDRWRVGALSRVRLVADEAGDLDEIHLYGLFRRSRPPSIASVLRLDGDGEPLRNARSARLGSLMADVRDFFADGRRTVLLGRSRWDFEQGGRLPHAFDEEIGFIDSFTEGFLEVFDRVEHLRRLPDGRWIAAGRLVDSKRYALRRFEPDGRPDASWRPGLRHGFVLGLWTFEDGRIAMHVRGREASSIYVLDAGGGEQSRFELDPACHGQRPTPLADGSWLLVCRAFREADWRLYSARGGEGPRELAERFLGSAERLPELLAANRFFEGPFELRRGEPVLIPRPVTEEARRLRPWPENEHRLQRWSAGGELLLSLRYPLPGPLAGIVPLADDRFWLLGYRRTLSPRGAMSATEGLIVEMGLDGAVRRVVSLGGKPILTRLKLSLSHPGGGFFAAGHCSRRPCLQHHGADGSLVHRPSLALSDVEGLWPAADGGLWLTQEIRQPPFDAVSSLRLSEAGQVELDAEGRPVAAPPIPEPPKPPWHGRHAARRASGLFEHIGRLSDGRWVASVRPWSSKQRTVSLARLDDGGRRDEDFERNAGEVLEAFTTVRDTYTEPKPRHRLTLVREDWRDRILVALSSAPRRPETLLRLQRDGTLDRGFDPPSAAIERLHDLVVARDGTVFVAGELRHVDKRFFLMRLSAEGRALSFTHGPGHAVEDLWPPARRVSRRAPDRPGPRR